MHAVDDVLHEKSVQAVLHPSQHAAQHVLLSPGQEDRDIGGDRDQRLDVGGEGGRGQGGGGEEYADGLKGVCWQLYIEIPLESETAFEGSEM